MRRTRIRLLPRNANWTEVQRDAIRALECSIGLRGLHRPGDIVEVPLTNGHIQKMLKKVGARRSGNHYARACLAELVAMNVIEDTGKVIVPMFDEAGKRRTKRTNGGRRKYSSVNPNITPWYRVFRVIPIFRSVYPSQRPDLPALSVTGCLLSFLRCQGLIPKKRERYRPRKGSVQEAFLILGPP